MVTTNPQPPSQIVSWQCSCQNISVNLKKSFCKKQNPCRFNKSQVRHGGTVLYISGISEGKLHVHSFAYWVSERWATNLQHSPLFLSFTFQFVFVNPELCFVYKSLQNCLKWNSYECSLRIKPILQNIYFVFETCLFQLYNTKWWS